MTDARTATILAAGDADAIALLERAKSSFGAGDLAASERQFRDLLLLGTDDAEALYGLGRVRLAAGDAAAARASFMDALESDPRHANALFELGFLAEGRRAHGAAKESYRRVLEINPQHAGARARLDVLLQREMAPPSAGDAAPPPTPAVPPAPTAAPSPPGVPMAAPPGRSPAARDPEAAERATAAYGLFSILADDPDPLARQTLRLIDRLRMTVRPQATAYLGSLVGPAVAAALALAVQVGGPPAAFRAIAAILAVLVLTLSVTSFGVLIRAAALAAFAAFFVGCFVVVGTIFAALAQLSRPGAPQEFDFGAPFRRIAGLVAAVPWAWLIIGACALVPVATLATILSTTITLDKGRLQMRQGVLGTQLVNVELWRVHDVALERTWLNTLTRDGTLVLRLNDYSGAKGPIRVVGLLRGDALDAAYQDLLNLVASLRSLNAIKGVVQ